MSNVVSLPVNTDVSDAWTAYCAAREKAEKSRHIDDGIAAGHAWRAWLSLFEGRR